MVYNKSLDEFRLIAALLADVQKTHDSVLNNSQLRNTILIVKRRCESEGISFLTKTLPRLGKALDKALCGTPLNATSLYFSVQAGSKLPRFLGELFNCVFNPDGTVLQDPCANCVRSLRQVLYLFYKYELPNDPEQEQKVISAFVDAESDLSAHASSLCLLGEVADTLARTHRASNGSKSTVQVIREARILLSNLFSTFDPLDIIPRHGPGAVATKQKHHEKFQWTNVSDRITGVFPFDEYFCSSMGHVCDRYDSFESITAFDLPAKVILVPKDSRGPRLISCEPVDFQWIQQGVGRRIVEHVEKHELTKFSVFFTDQTPNQIGALFGSRNGRYVTIDLKEASDRVSFDLVRLLFPTPLFEVIKNCRSLETVLPDGTVLPLKKFAPMGSCLCFPIMALTIWAILHAGSPDAYTRERIHVYGDDVIVTKDYSLDAIEHLESLGLKVNRDKSCIEGSFRESCGKDAFMGIDVTPVRYRTVLSSPSSASVYTSWIAYANSMYDRHNYYSYDCIVALLSRRFDVLAGGHGKKSSFPSLREVAPNSRPIKRRYNRNLQRFEYKVPVEKVRHISPELDGWSKLLRWFTESARNPNRLSSVYDWSNSEDSSKRKRLDKLLNAASPLDASQYTLRNTSMLVYRWR